MKTRAFFLSACISGLALVAFACSTTTTVDDTSTDEDSGANTNNDPGNNNPGNNNPGNNGDDDSGTTNPGKDSGSPASGTTCADVCAQEAKPACASAPSTADCVSKCEALSSQVPAQCNGYYDAFLSCSAGATFTCNDKDLPTTSSCAAEGAALLKCVNGGSTPDGGSTTDGGTDGGSTDSGADDGGTCYDDTAAKAYPSTVTVGKGGDCTGAQVDAIVDGCLGAGGTDAACKTATGAPNDTCSKCVFGNNGNLPPILTLEGTALVDYNACIAIEIGHPECALALANQDICPASACETCADTTSEKTCEDEAVANVCSSLFDPAKVPAGCQAALGAVKDTDPAVTKCIGSGTSFAEAAKLTARVFCVDKRN